eukprot:scaffold298201_cov17-Prasinocladus_malaysianus.AAC.1
MLGYCGKRDVPGNCNLRAHILNNNLDEYAEGKYEYDALCECGSAPLSKRTCLDRKNICLRSHMYALMPGGDAAEPNLKKVLLRMCRLGRFDAAAEWTVTHVGAGMDPDR